MTLANDRLKRTKIILPKTFPKRGLNMDRVDINEYDTPHASTLLPNRKPHIGERGGLYVIIEGKRRYLRG